eukprot:2870466-Prymnesium_polylepis.2
MFAVLFDRFRCNVRVPRVPTASPAARESAGSVRLARGRGIAYPRSYGRTGAETKVPKCGSHLVSSAGRSGGRCEMSISRAFVGRWRR